VRRKFNIPDLNVALPTRRAGSQPDAVMEPFEPDDAGETEETLDEPGASQAESEPAPADESVPREFAAVSSDPQQYDKAFERADDEEEVEQPQPKSEFSYIAPTASTRASTTWIFLLVLLALLLSGIFFLYYQNFRAQPRPPTAKQAAQEYMLALRMKQETTRQQLATPDSRGLLLPAWFIISEALVTSVAESGDNKATARARITLAPVRSIDLQRELEKAASSEYDVEFTLERGAEYWLVDQRSLFSSLSRRLKAQNPGVGFPTWDGVSE